MDKRDKAREHIGLVGMVAKRVADFDVHQFTVNQLVIFACIKQKINSIKGPIWGGWSKFKNHFQPILAISANWNNFDFDPIFPPFPPIFLGGLQCR